MKTALLPVIALFTIGGLAAVSQASDSTIEIDSRSFAAIAYSPATGKYGCSYEHRSRSAAEKAALEKCGAEDAQIACWVNEVSARWLWATTKPAGEWAGATVAARAIPMQKIPH